MTGREERTGILLGTGSAGAGPLVEMERQMALESPDAAVAVSLSVHGLERPGVGHGDRARIKGPNVTITQKDAAALNALFYGRILLSDGRADALLVGGADEWNLQYHLAYERLHATRTARRSGFVLGEGAACLVVEDEAAARARGAAARARVASVVMRPAALSPQVRRADAARLAEAMNASLDEAGVPPPASGSSTCHGTASPRRDDAEAAALAAVFSEAPARGRRQGGDRREPLRGRRAARARGGGPSRESGARRRSRQRVWSGRELHVRRPDEALTKWRGRGGSRSPSTSASGVDSYGVVWHGHYVQYFEVARTPSARPRA